MTTLVKWAPFTDLLGLQDEINGIFNENYRTNRSTGFLSPVVELSETKEEYRVKADLPGISKDQIDVSVNDNVLSLKAERKELKEEKETNYFKKELRYGTYFRQFNLPENVDSEKIKAVYDNGVLEVRIPKAEKAQSKKISIE